VTDSDRLESLKRSLTNITPGQEQIERIEALRAVAIELGQSIIDSCPESRERSLGLTHLEDAVMWSVKSIVLE
jgi:hypothetical protein